MFEIVAQDINDINDIIAWAKKIIITKLEHLKFDWNLL